MPNRIGLAGLCAIFIFAAAMQAAAQDPGCQFIGNTSCGGDDHNQSAPHERFYAEQCSNGTVQHRCFAENQCAAVNKGRVNIAVGPAWTGGYVFRQAGDSLWVRGTTEGEGTGVFTGPFTIEITWKGGQAYSGTVRVKDGRAYRIEWNRPPGNHWDR